MFSEAVQDYVKAIYQLRGEPGGATTSAIARRLGVAAPSVCNMVRHLADLGLAEQAPYRGVRLTRDGERAALEVIRHHRLVERYLAEALGLPWDRVHAEAERLEHALSEPLEEALDAALGRPERDPHGHPIPSKDGRLPTETAVPLADLEPARPASIHSVDDRDPEFLRYANGLGLLPGREVTVLAREPFDGPMEVRLSDGTQRVLGREAARRILVASAGLAQAPPTPAPRRPRPARGRRRLARPGRR
jgi:DtxR family Mn-dependent transcriptional regulator